MNLFSFSRLVALPHSVFALPFALASFVLAARMGRTFEFQHSLPVTLILVVFCLGLARTAAMAFNRVIDSRIDGENPRTRRREIPSGSVSTKEGSVIVVVTSLGFFFCSYLLGWHCLALAPFVLLVLLGYSYVKRVSPLVHFVLGLALALAPGGAWWILRPTIDVLPLVLMFAVLCWVAGFDIIYSCQDVLFDREHRLHSFPVRFGVESALVYSELVHVAAWVAFVLVGLLAGLGVLYACGMLLFAALLVYEHRIVSATDLSRVNQAFFTVNGVIGVFYFLLVLLSLAITR